MGTVQNRHSTGDLFALAAGRVLALGLHPLVAWRVRPRSRTPLVVGYFVASYAIVLAALLLFQ